MRVWVDLTNSPHVLVARPLVRLLEEEGHEVLITARDHAQTVALLERFGLPYHLLGHHGGPRLGGRAQALLARSGALLRFLRRAGPLDLALGHGSNDLVVVARLLGVPATTAFDYEYATLQHHLNCRLAQTVVVPEAIPPDRLRRFGAARKLARYPGLKEEYYLADFKPDPSVLEQLSLTQDRPLVVVRTPPEGALYHRFQSTLYPALIATLKRAAREEEAQVVVLPRNAGQRAALATHPEFLLPAAVVDAQSLIAFATLVVSAGGTMNREAAALGVPVASIFQGRLGAVDAALLRSGRLVLVRTAGELKTVVRDAFSKLGNKGRGAPIRRDPRALLALFLRPLSTAAGPSKEA